MYVTLAHTVESPELVCATSARCPPESSRSASGRSHVLKATRELLPNGRGRGELRAADEEAVLWVLRHELAELTHLCEGDTAEDKDDESPVVCEPGPGLDPQQVGAAREERTDGGCRVVDVAQLGDLHMHRYARMRCIDSHA